MLKKYADRWVKALRSGKYKQGTKHLTVIDAGEEKDCCLGVLCKITKTTRTKTLEQEHFLYGENSNESSYNVLPYSVVEKVGMKSVEGEVVYKGKSPTLLSCLNDEGKSFKQIANIIAKNYNKL